MDAMDPCPIQKLPLEVIEVICSYLTPQELAACCAVSHNLRDLFGSDFVWRSHCDKELAEYLSTTPCKVEPGFVSPETEVTLTPVSRWRMAFMRQNHLYNNWRQGKQIQEEFKNQHTKRSSRGALFHEFQTNDVIIVLYKDKIELLDVKEYPAADATETIHFAPYIFDHLKINTENNTLVTIYGTGVQVFHLDFSSKQHSLEHVFFVEESQKLSSKTPHDVKKAFDKMISSISFMSVHIVVGSLFVGTLEGNTTLHIWDLNSGLKVKEQTCPTKPGRVEYMKASDTMNVVLSVREEWQSSVIFLVYSLTKFSFLPFRETFQNVCIHSVLKDTVAIQSNYSLHVFNYQNSELLLKDHLVNSVPQVIKDSFLFVADGVLKIFIPTTKLVVSLPLNGVHFFAVISSKFVQINSEVFEFYEKNNTLKKTSMILPFSVCRFFLNKASTRYILRYAFGKATGIHFW